MIYSVECVADIICPGCGLPLLVSVSESIVKNKCPRCKTPIRIMVRLEREIVKGGQDVGRTVFTEDRRDYETCRGKRQAHPIHEEVFS